MCLFVVKTAAAYLYGLNLKCVIISKDFMFCLKMEEKFTSMYFLNQGELEKEITLVHTTYETIFFIDVLVIFFIIV